MKSQINFRDIAIEIISLLFVLLFVYASVSKLLDFENFQVQLAQSPLLSAFASWVSWLVPLIELVIASILIIPKLRLIGLFLSLSLMTMFTAYIFVVLHYSSFVPCSCGGILEKMSWDVHLIFNVVFVLLSIAAILLNKQYKDRTVSKKAYVLSTKWIVPALIFSMSTVIVLFVSSEGIMHHDNPFIRRYPPHPVEFSNALELKINSYYLAGFTGGRLYLGNHSNPLHIESTDNNLQKRKIANISFDPGKIPFKSVVISIRDSYFYLCDGSVPKVFRGSLKDWRISKELKGVPYFTLAVPLDSTTIAFRSNNAKNAANVLGVFQDGEHPDIKYSRDLLERQLDGIFDTDGTLMYSEQLQRILYLYYYRNGFIVADKNGSLDHRGNTIDTVKHARIKVTTLDNGKQHVMSSPPFVVNSRAALCENLLFVHSKVKGKYESDRLWESSFIIDVYDLRTNAYIMSFPVYHTANKVLNSLLVTPTHLYAMIGSDLVVYEIHDILRKEMKKK
jgi:uncharacterized membrane protein YphA (DoxX/SURF4 family)